MRGTSFATPIVTGVAALLLSLQIQRGEAPDPQKVRAAIKTTTNRGKPAISAGTDLGVRSDCSSRSTSGRPLPAFTPDRPSLHIKSDRLHTVFFHTKEAVRPTD